ncbi:MAG: hypothetical protein GY810_15405, partial [Aureispira sp.]|nr:hypothetical protein [Aureispira sp.]
MKNLIYVFALSIATISCNNAQNNGVLAENNGQQLTEQQFQAYPTLIEFLVEEQLTASEVQRLREQAIQEFNNNPAVMMQDVASTQQAIESIKAMQDATQVGLTRQTLLAELHKASLLQGTGAPNSEFTNIIQAHAPVIAYDPQSNLVITEKNIEGIAGYYNFMYQLYGYDYQVSAQEVQQFRQQMVAGFNSLPLDQKQMFCVMSTMNQVMRSAWAQMTIAEQQQYQQQLIA